MRNKSFIVVCAFVIGACGDDTEEIIGSDAGGQDGSVTDPGMPVTGDPAGTSGGGAGGTSAPTDPQPQDDGGTPPMNNPGSDGGADDPGMPVSAGGQLAACTQNSDCDDGLNCFVWGEAGYCSTACAQDADCESLGEAYDCFQPGGGFMGGGFMGGGGPGGGFMGGGGPGGGFMGGAADAATPEPEADGVCRATCSGPDDDSCPGALTCLPLGGGGFMGGGGPGGGFMGGGPGGGGQFRCGHAEADDDDDDDGDMGGGSAAAFAECATDGDCSGDLECTAFGGGFGGGMMPGMAGSGYCTQSCASDADCSEEPSSGEASLICGFAGLCVLECAGDEAVCPDEMSCNMFGGGGFMGGGGGGMATGRCNY